MIKEELNRFAEWLAKEKEILIFKNIEEYLLIQTKPIKTKDELMTFLSTLHDIHKPDLFRKYKGHNIARARGHLIKFILHNPVMFPLFSSKTIFYKIFGLYADHSTALHFKNSVDFFGEELKKYQELSNYLNTYDIKWEI
jgi:hypothetical protein